jgi:hypothetical protein
LELEGLIQLVVGFEHDAGLHKLLKAAGDRAVVHLEAEEGDVAGDE